MNRSRTLTIVTVVALVGMLAFPMAATAATDLSIDVAQAPETGDALVTVTENGTAVENATVTVTAEAGYAGNGTYTTQNGTIELPEPDETVSVTVNASSDNGTASRQVELVPRAASLDVSANQSSDGSATVTVSQYDEPVENASVEVDAAADIAGNDTTGENGTVTLDQPDEDVNATITATSGNLSAETTAALEGTDLRVSAEQRDSGVVVAVTDGDEPVENATVAVDSDDDYAGTGTYATDADGEVALPLPAENVTINVTATAGNESATTAADLTADFVEPEDPFGLAVSQFVNALQNVTTDSPPGQIISEFVTSNNPGNADSAPGQSGDAPGNAGGAPGQSGAAPGQADAAPGQSGDAPGNAGEAPGQSGESPGNAGDAPGRSGGDDADDDGNETAEEDEDDGNETGSNGNAPDDAGPDSDEDDGQDTDDGDGTETETEAPESDDESDDEASDDADEDDDAGGESSDTDEDGDADSESDDAPGNSGNAPGRN